MKSRGREREALEPDYISLLGGGHKKISQTGSLKQQYFIFSQSQRLEVQDPGVSRVSFSLGL